MTVFRGSKEVSFPTKALSKYVPLGFSIKFTVSYLASTFFLFSSRNLVVKLISVLALVLEPSFSLVGCWEFIFVVDTNEVELMLIKRLF
jgi:hypothetical protein